MSLYLRSMPDTPENRRIAARMVELYGPDKDTMSFMKWSGGVQIFSRELTRASIGEVLVTSESCSGSRSSSWDSAMMKYFGPEYTVRKADSQMAADIANIALREGGAGMGEHRRDEAVLEFVNDSDGMLLYPIVFDD